LLVPPSFDPELLHFDESHCDDRGRFWAGVMFDPAEGSLPPHCTVQVL
jgi:hypothetical protein